MKLPKKRLAIQLKNAAFGCVFLLRNYLLLLVRGDAEYYFVL